MRKLISCVTLVVAILVPFRPSLADDGSPNSQPLGLTGVSPGWYGGMVVVVNGNTTIYADPYQEEKLGTVKEVVRGQVPHLPPRVVHNWTTHQVVKYAAQLEINDRVAVLPLQKAFSFWRGMGWVPEDNVLPLDFYQGQFGKEEKNPQPSLYVCSH